MIQPGTQLPAWRRGDKLMPSVGPSVPPSVPRFSLANLSNSEQLWTPLDNSWTTLDNSWYIGQLLALFSLSLSLSLSLSHKSQEKKMLQSYLCKKIWATMMGSHS